MIRDHLAKWYVDKEFEPKTVVQKKKKTVDIKPKR
jgi:hypothetical protein